MNNHQCSCGQWFIGDIIDHCPTCAMFSHNPHVNYKLPRMSPGRIIEHALNMPDLSQAEHDRLEDMQCYGADDYAEPGYTTHNHLDYIVLGNYNPPNRWNDNGKDNASKSFTRTIDLLERVADCQWDDQWTTCDDCGKLVRIDADCYGWTRYYHEYECYRVCFDCIDKNEYLEDIQDNPHKAIVHPDLNPLDYGFESYNGQFENGWHPGQTDDPSKIAEKVLADGFDHYVFQIDDVGQFDCRFRVYVKKCTDEDCDKHWEDG